jgi:hypothetical protein
LSKKPLAIILIVLGGYLAVGNTIFSLIFNQVIFSGGGPGGDPIQLSPEEYWLNWWMQFGPITLLIAGIGIFLLVFGTRLFMRDKNQKTVEKLVVL